MAARGGPSQCSATAASEALCKFVAWTLYKTATALAAAALALAAARIVVNVQWRRKKTTGLHTGTPAETRVFVPLAARITVCYINVTCPASVRFGINTLSIPPFLPVYPHPVRLLGAAAVSTGRLCSLGAIGAYRSPTPLLSLLRVQSLFELTNSKPTKLAL